MNELSTPAQQDVWQIVRQINASWVEGQPERLHEHFHDRMTIFGTSGHRYGAGKLACIESYRSFIDSAQITRFEETDPSIEVYETVAIVSYRFEIKYAMGGKTHQDSGRDTFVLERVGGKWLAVWRQLADHASS
jgi:hypothetical protein